MMIGFGNQPMTGTKFLKMCEERVLFITHGEGVFWEHNGKHFLPGGQLFNDQLNELDRIQEKRAYRAYLDDDTQLPYVREDDMVEETKYKAFCAKYGVEQAAFCASTELISGNKENGYSFTKVNHLEGLDLKKAIDECFADWYKTDDGKAALKALEGVGDYEIDYWLSNINYNIPRPDNDFTRWHGFVIERGEYVEKYITISDDFVPGKS